MAGIAVEFVGMLRSASDGSRNRLVADTVSALPTLSWASVPGTGPVSPDCLKVVVYNNDNEAVGVAFSDAAEPTRYWVIQPNRSREIVPPAYPAATPLRVKII